ncbi:MAG: glycosyltransferase [Rhodocyclaceae bacterium]|nr:glycosyltransferase [Rhodocyclaceae bacterium]MDZ4215947.1 glycosyltransferase [Rhodocyclaceae bacterium]
MSTRLTLSLVIPVYNVAPYLPRCLESLAVLDPPADEIIVVDDGSTDDCPHILADFKPRLPQMRIIRQENGGLSAARNTGLDAATGTYLAFVDSDDFLEPDAYAEALRIVEDEQLDMVLFNGEYHFEGRQPDRLIYTDAPDTGVIRGSDWLRRRLKAGRFLHMVWLHLYRRDFIERHHFRFVPRLIHEDVIWTTQALLAAQRVRYLPRISVHYRIPIRTATPEVRQRRLETIIESSIYNARTQAELASTVAVDVELHRLLRHQLVDGALSIFHLMAKMPDRNYVRQRLAGLRREGFLAFLWRHAEDLAQRRRIAKHWLRSWLA